MQQSQEPDFEQDESSIISYDKSESDMYSSFINDIRTVYELQDEENMSHADAETVIKKPTPLPDLDESEITLMENYAGHSETHSVIIKDVPENEDSYGNIQNDRNQCPTFPIVNVGKKESCDHERHDSGVAYNFVRLNSLHTFHKTSSSIGGRSFGSKVVSRRVSPKNSQVPQSTSLSRASSSQESLK